MNKRSRCRILHLLLNLGCALKNLNSSLSVYYLMILVTLLPSITRQSIVCHEGFNVGWMVWYSLFSEESASVGCDQDVVFEAYSAEVFVRLQ